MNSYRLCLLGHVNGFNFCSSHNRDIYGLLLFVYTLTSDIYINNKQDNTQKDFPPFTLFLLLFLDGPAVQYRPSPPECPGLFISPSGIYELDCATTKTDTAERSISIGREYLQVFCIRGLGVLPGSTLRGSRD